MVFAFISRHEPTLSQIKLAAKQGVKLQWIGDKDAFTVWTYNVFAHGCFDGVVVVHPAAAMRLAEDYIVGVFENKNRAPVGEKPQFEAASFHMYDLRTKL